MSKANSAAREVFVDGVFLNREERLVWEQKLFKRLLLSNGLVKTTCARRLDDANRVILKSIRGRWPDATLCVLDVAVSSGITTLELAEAMRLEGFKFKMIGTDFRIESSLLSYGRVFHVLSDGRGRALQFEAFGFPVANYLGRGLKVCYRFVPVLLGRALFLLLIFPPIRRLIEPASRPIRLLTCGWQWDPDVAFLEEDVFNVATDGMKHHIIRAANVLNPQVFSRAQLAQAVDRLRYRLRTGGLLLILRTYADGSNHGACYELQGDGTFRRFRLLGDGCEIERIVLAGTLDGSSSGGCLETK